MQRYNPRKAPNPKEWLSLDEQERIDLVADFHRRARISLPDETMHATIHAVVENQVATGDELPVARTLDRLMTEGLDRHDALHAIGMELVWMMNGALRDPEPGADPNAAYFAAIERITAASWRRSADEPTSDDLKASEDLEASENLELEEGWGPEDILDALNDPGPLPTEAIRAADAQRAAMAPMFIEIIEHYLAAKPRPAVADALFFVFHMLGSWREKSAYRSLAKLLSLPADELEPILGGACSETAHRVMAAVFDGDPQPLYDLVLKEQADEFVRSRMCEAIAMLSLRGELPRTEAARFLRTCYSDVEPQDECSVWDGWQRAIAMLGLSELRPLVERAFERGFINPLWLTLEHFEEDLQHGIEGTALLASNGEYDPFGDTIEELSTWAFDDKDDETSDAGLWDEPALPMVPYVNPNKHVGRNDPCPCGSGKKFKKCCLSKEPTAGG
jgi:hypothetical protein